VLALEVEDAVGSGGEGDDVVDAAAHGGARAAAAATTAASGPRREELRRDAPHRRECDDGVGAALLCFSRAAILHWNFRFVDRK
jgi:hypothetical protein